MTTAVNTTEIIIPVGITVYLRRDGRFVGEVTTITSGVYTMDEIITTPAGNSYYVKRGTSLRTYVGTSAFHLVYGPITYDSWAVLTT